jgi:uncharacterized protein YndB with AHSA1/START domain
VSLALIRESTLIAAAPERIWQALAVPERIAEWFADSSRGEAVTGGKLAMRFERLNFEIVFNVRHAAQPSALLLDAQMPSGPLISTEFTLSAENGKTRVTLTQSGLPDVPEMSEQREGMRSGWKMSLAILRYYVERHFGEPRASFFSMHPASFEYESLQPFFHRREQLSVWLTESGEIGAEGSFYELRLKDGSPMSGYVLADTGMELALEWREKKGVVELKAISMGQSSRAVAVRGCGWGMDGGEAARIEAFLAEAIERLAGAQSLKQRPA